MANLIFPLLLFKFNFVNILGTKSLKSFITWINKTRFVDLQFKIANVHNE